MTKTTFATHEDHAKAMQTWHVVDASEHAVKSGQTNPSELIAFLRSGVEVHSAENLHAKVYVFRDAADYWSDRKIPFRCFYSFL